MCALNDISTFRVPQQIVFDGKEHFHRCPLFDLPHEYRRLQKAVEPLRDFAQCGSLCNELLYDQATILPCHIVLRRPTQVQAGSRTPLILFSQSWFSNLQRLPQRTGEKLWVITEADRSVTTLLFPSEY